MVIEVEEVVGNVVIEVSITHTPGIHLAYTYLAWMDARFDVAKQSKRSSVG